MTDRRGKPKVVTDEELLSLFLRLDGPVFSSSELAEEVRIGRAGVHKRLKEMEEQGWVGSKRVGGGRAWWITDEGRSFLREGGAGDGEDTN